MSPRERRRETRCEVLGLSGSTGVCDQLIVKDLSASGMRIETTARPRPGGTFRAHLAAPGGPLELHATCCWAHLAGIARLSDSGPTTLYQAGLHANWREVVAFRKLLHLFHDHALVPPPFPVHCILPFEDGRGQEPVEPIAGEVRRLGLKGLALVFPPLPSLPARMDLVLLLEGRDCRCRFRVLERRESRISAGAHSTELLVMLEDADRATVSPIRQQIQSALSAVLGPLDTKDLDGIDGTVSMLA